MNAPDIILLLLIALVCLAVTVRNVVETMESWQSFHRARRVIADGRNRGVAL